MDYDLYRFKTEMACRNAALHHVLQEKTKPWTMCGFMHKPNTSSDEHEFHKKVSEKYNAVCIDPEDYSFRAYYEFDRDVVKSMTGQIFYKTPVLKKSS